MKLSSFSRFWAASSRTRRGASPCSTRLVLAVDALESRQLLTTGLTEFSGPFSIPTDIAVGGDGNLWVLNNGYKGDSSLVVIGTDQSIKGNYSIPTANSGATALTLGPDGNIWFTESQANKIGKITPQGVVTEYDVPDTTEDLGFGPESVSASPTDIVAGPGGALWFTEPSAQAVGRITTAGVVTQILTPNQQPTSITIGPDKNVWYTDTNSSNTIDRINADHSISSFPVPTQFADPVSLTTGPDGALWFVEDFNHAIGRITTAGVVTEMPIRADIGTPQQLAFDSAGNLWITGSNASLVRVTPAGLTSTLGEQNSPIGNALAITNGPDGALWFTDTGRDLIGRVDPSTVSLISTDHPLSGSPIDPGQWTFNGLALTGDVATFYDGNPAGTASDFTASINWGEGSTSTGTIHAGDDGGFLVSSDHTFASAQTATITVTITDVNPAHTPQPNVLTVSQSFDTSYGTTTYLPVSVTTAGGGFATPLTPPSSLTVGPVDTTTPEQAVSKTTTTPTVSPTIALPPLLQTSLNVQDAIAIFRAKAAGVSKAHIHHASTHHALSHPTHKVGVAKIHRGAVTARKHR